MNRDACTCPRCSATDCPEPEPAALPDPRRCILCWDWIAADEATEVDDGEVVHADCLADARLRWAAEDAQDEADRRGEMRRERALDGAELEG